MRERLVTISISKEIHNTEQILKTYELSIYGDINYTTSSFYKKKVLKTVTSEVL